MATKNLKSAQRERLQDRIAKALDAKRQADEARVHNAECQAHGGGELRDVPVVEMPAECTPWWER